MGPKSQSLIAGRNNCYATSSRRAFPITPSWAKSSEPMATPRRTGGCSIPSTARIRSSAACRFTACWSVSKSIQSRSDARHIGQRLGAQWNGLLTDTALQRGWGDCYGHCLVATGRADIMLDPRMHAWDCAALIPILQEAGGRFTDWRGRVTTDGGDAVSSNGGLHDQVLQHLRSSD